MRGMDLEKMSRCSLAFCTVSFDGRDECFSVLRES